MKHDFWQKGRAFDLWSVPHFLFGVIMSFLPYIFSISLSASFALMLMVAILWELVEKAINIQETLTNNMFDVILPVISFVATSMFLRQIEISKDAALVFFSAVLAIYAFANISGWLAFRRRQREFMN